MRLEEFVRTPVITCRPEATLGEVASAMEAHRVGSLVAVDEHGDVVGIVTDRDLVVSGLARDLGPDASIERVMSQDVVSVREDADVFEAVELMAKHRCRRLPVVDADGYPTTVVSFNDLFLLFAQQSDELATTVAAETTPIAT